MEAFDGIHVPVVTENDQSQVVKLPGGAETFYLRTLSGRAPLQWGDTSPRQHQQDARHHCAAVQPRCSPRTRIPDGREEAEGDLQGGTSRRAPAVPTRRGPGQGVPRPDSQDWGAGH